ncbi:hypothetical protein P8C59_007907 [Phyllachora maydis]|uniref:DNA mismatch repair protein MSH5 n=1 Tax=Phyllachora maydis TaxID=1825666 RepID=A0AAD9IAP3_9PEZI|nr:hypothetical protein P8C59_007907 [Phyllachora maydis]
MKFRVKSVKMFTLSDSMFINADTLASLQILRSENHPNSQMQGPGKSQSGAKESLSVYGLVQALASTPQGKSKLRQIFLRPSVDLEKIHQRQQTIAVLLNPENAQILDSLSATLKKIKNMRRPILLLHKGVDLPTRHKNVHNSVWLSLFRFAKYAVELRETALSLFKSDQLEICIKIRDQTDARQIVQVGEHINRIVDFDESKISQRTVVCTGVNEELDELKRTFHGLSSFLTSVAHELVQTLPEWAIRYIQCCTFMPQLGFLVVVTLDPNTGKGYFDGEGIEADSWVAMFQNEGQIFYKNNMMRDLDRRIGDMYCKIIDMEIDILHELSVQVLRREETLITASDLFGELDSMVALAQSAQKYSWVAPRLTTANTIHVKAGRHPLQELTVSSFVPNDCTLAGGPGLEAPDAGDGDVPEVDAPSMLVLTGPNHSGKSIYLKQVALIVYLAHIGSYVPAESATVGLTDRILTRIATRESVSHKESAFAIDLRQAAFAINFATRRSLVLIDEFGKGTSPNNGAGLATSLLQYFLGLGPERPKVLAATHFHEMFEGGFLRNAETNALAFAHMNIRVDLEADSPDDQVTFLFELVDGRSISSFGTKCAAFNGVKEAVVERAEALTLLQARGEDLQVACGHLDAASSKELEKAEAMARLFLEKDIPRQGGSKQHLGSDPLGND